MTWDSMDSRPMRVSRLSSRSTSFRASAGSSSAASFSFSSLQVVALVVLAQLALDGLDLLAEEHLPLPLAQLFLDLRLDVFLRVQHADLALDVHQHPAEPLLDAQRLEQHLPLLGRDVDVAGDQVGEPARVVDPGQHLLDHLVGQAGLLAQLGGAGARLPVEGDEGRIFDVERQPSPRPRGRSPGGSRPYRCSAWRCRAARRGAAAACRTARAGAGRCGRWSRWCRGRRSVTLSTFCRCETAKTSRSGWPARPRWRGGSRDGPPRSAR